MSERAEIVGEHGVIERARAFGFEEFDDLWAGHLVGVHENEPGHEC